MFVEQSYKLQATYKDNAKKYMNSESQLVDFKTAAEKARNIINSWVSSQTNNKINDLIPAGEFDSTNIRLFAQKSNVR
jgi:serpin B